MPRAVTWRSWAALAAFCMIYAALGWWLSSSDMTEAWLYRIGLAAATAGEVLFAVAYAANSAGWWRTDVSATLVRLAVAWIPTTGPLAYVFWFNGGRLTTSWLAWLAVSGPAVSALFLFRAAWIWFRLGRMSAPVTCPVGHAAPATAVYCPACGRRIGARTPPSA